MTTPMQPTRKDPVVAMRENLAYLREQGASREEIDAEVARWARKIASFNERETVQNDPLNLAGRNPKMANLLAAGKAGGETAQTFAAGLPGVGLAMSGLRGLAGDTDIEQNKRDVESATTDTPASALGRMAGGAVFGPAIGGSALRLAGMALPARAAQSLAKVFSGTRAGTASLAQHAATGSTAGAVDQLLSGAPDLTPLNRAKRVVAGAEMGAVLGPAAQGAARLGFGVRDWARSAHAPSRGAQELAAVANREATAGPMFAQAEASGKVTQGPAQFPGDPDIRAYVDDVLSSPSFRARYPNPSQQDVLKAVREHVLDSQQAAASGVAAQGAKGSQRAQAGTRMAKDDADLLAARLLDESDYFSQGNYRPAVQEYAAASGAIEAAHDAAQGTRGMVNRAWVPGQRLRTQSPEAFEQAIPDPGPAPTSKQFTSREITAAVPAARAGLAESQGFSFAPWTGFGYGKALQHSMRGNRFLRPLEAAKAGKALATPKTLRDAILAAAVGY